MFSVMANSLAKLGHNVWIITHKVEGEDYSHFHKNVKIVFVSSIRYEGGLPPTFKENLRYAFEAINKGFTLIKKEKIDVVHSNNFSPALASSILSSITGCPHITAIWDIFTLCGSDYWSRWASQTGVSKIHAFLGPRFERMILRMKHSAIHTISEASKDDLVKFGSSKPIYIIHPSIETMKHTKKKPNCLQFVYVGRLVFYKNLETAIYAVSIVKKSYENISLKIIGGGPHEKNLKNLVNKLGLEKNVEFCGYETEDFKYDTISSSIAMMFPSLCEGFGLVILESFSCYRPVIVSNVRPLSDIISNKKDGLVEDAKDGKKWAEAMIFLIENEEIAIKMGIEGREKLDKLYTQDSMIAKVESMYQDVISLN